jgi:hypothetical protein
MAGAMCKRHYLGTNLAQQAATFNEFTTIYSDI